MRDFFASAERSPRMDRGDRKLLWILTAVYLLFALINLGTLSFPTTVWKADSAVSSACIDLGEVRDVAGISINGNIASGHLLFTADDGGSYDYSQQYGEMFSWKNKPVDFHTRYIYLTLVSGDISLNEIAFYDSAGNLLPAVVAEAKDSTLVDEQNTAVKTSTYFNGMIFDEIYHARTAYEFLHTMSVYEWTHPPLGKILIALGVAVFGMKPFGWRIVPALFGAAMLPVMFMLSKRLFRRRDLSFLAAALFALDTMHYSQTRIATVDVFIVFFILWMYYFMTVFLQKDFLRGTMRDLFLPLGACGISFGLGVASKWTGLYAGLGLAVLFFGHLIAQGIRAYRDGERTIFWKRATATCIFCIAFFLVIPLLIYFLSYIPFFRFEKTQRSEYGLKEAIKTVIQQQESMYGYHSNLTATHLCQSNWYEWPFAARSVWFYFSSGDKTVSNISSFGNPAVWWISAVAALALTTDWIFRRLRGNKKSWKQASVILLIGIAANLLPWTLVTRCTFQYHFFPTLPFMLLTGVLLIQHLEDRGELSPRAKWIWLATAAVYYLLLLPAASGIPMPRLYAQFIEYVLPTGVIFHGAV